MRPFGGCFAKRANSARGRFVPPPAGWGALRRRARAVDYRLRRVSSASGGFVPPPAGWGALRRRAKAVDYRLRRVRPASGGIGGAQTPRQGCRLPQPRRGRAANGLRRDERQRLRRRLGRRRTRPGGAFGASTGEAPASAAPGPPGGAFGAPDAWSSGACGAGAARGRGAAARRAGSVRTSAGACGAVADVDGHVRAAPSAPRRVKLRRLRRRGRRAAPSAPRTRGAPAPAAPGPPARRAHALGNWFAQLTRTRCSPTCDPVPYWPPTSGCAERLRAERAQHDLDLWGLVVRGAPRDELVRAVSSGKGLAREDRTAPTARGPRANSSMSRDRPARPRGDRVDRRAADTLDLGRAKHFASIRISPTKKTRFTQNIYILAARARAFLRRDRRMHPRDAYAVFA